MRFSRTLIVAFCLMLTAGTAIAAKKNKPSPASVTIDSWWVLGPASYPFPAFHDAARGGVKPEQLLDSNPPGVRELAPGRQETVDWFFGAPLRWTATETGKRGEVALGSTDVELPDGTSIAWISIYVTADRFVAAKLQVSGAHPR